MNWKTYPKRKFKNCTILYSDCSPLWKHQVLKYLWIYVINTIILDIYFNEFWFHENDKFYSKESD